MSIINNFQEKCCKYCEKIVIRTEDHEYFNEHKCCDDCYIDFLEGNINSKPDNISKELIKKKLMHRKQIKMNQLMILIKEKD